MNLKKNYLYLFFICLHTMIRCTKFVDEKRPGTNDKAVDDSCKCLEYNEAMLGDAFRGLTALRKTGAVNDALEKNNNTEKALIFQNKIEDLAREHYNVFEKYRKDMLSDYNEEIKNKGFDANFTLYNDSRGIEVFRNCNYSRLLVEESLKMLNEQTTINLDETDILKDLLTPLVNIKKAMHTKNLPDIFYKYIDSLEILKEEYIEHAKSMKNFYSRCMHIMSELFVSLTAIKEKEDLAMFKKDENNSINSNLEFMYGYKDKHSKKLYNAIRSHNICEYSIRIIYDECIINVLKFQTANVKIISLIEELNKEFYELKNGLNNSEFNLGNHDDLYLQLVSHFRHLSFKYNLLQKNALATCHERLTYLLIKRNNLQKIISRENNGILHLIKQIMPLKFYNKVNKDDEKELLKFVTDSLFKHLCIRVEFGNSKQSKSVDDTLYLFQNIRLRYYTTINHLIAHFESIAHKGEHVFLQTSNPGCITGEVSKLLISWNLQMNAVERMIESFASSQMKLDVQIVLNCAKKGLESLILGFNNTYLEKEKIRNLSELTNQIRHFKMWFAGELESFGEAKTYFYERFEHDLEERYILVYNSDLLEQKAIETASKLTKAFQNLNEVDYHTYTAEKLNGILTEIINVFVDQAGIEREIAALKALFDLNIHNDFYNKDEVDVHFEYLFRLVDKNYELFNDEREKMLNNNKKTTSIQELESLSKIHLAMNNIKIVYNFFEAIEGIDLLEHCAFTKEKINDADVLRINGLLERMKVCIDRLYGLRRSDNPNINKNKDISSCIGSFFYYIRCGLSIDPKAFSDVFRTSWKTYRDNTNVSSDESPEISLRNSNGMDEYRNVAAHNPHENYLVPGTSSSAVGPSSIPKYFCDHFCIFLNDYIQIGELECKSLIKKNWYAFKAFSKGIREIIIYFNSCGCRDATNLECVNCLTKSLEEKIKENTQNAQQLHTYLVNFMEKIIPNDKAEDNMRCLQKMIHYLIDLLAKVDHVTDKHFGTTVTHPNLICTHSNSDIFTFDLRTPTSALAYFFKCLHQIIKNIVIDEIRFEHLRDHIKINLKLCNDLEKSMVSNKKNNVSFDNSLSKFAEVESVKIYKKALDRFREFDWSKLDLDSFMRYGRLYCFFYDKAKHCLQNEYRVETRKFIAMLLNGKLSTHTIEIVKNANDIVNSVSFTDILQKKRFDKLIALLDGYADLVSKFTEVFCEFNNELFDASYFVDLKDQIAKYILGSVYKLLSAYFSKIEKVEEYLKCTETCFSICQPLVDYSHRKGYFGYGDYILEYLIARITSLNFRLGCVCFSYLESGHLKDRKENIMEFKTYRKVLNDLCMSLKANNELYDTIMDACNCMINHYYIIVFECSFLEKSSAFQGFFTQNNVEPIVFGSEKTGLSGITSETRHNFLWNADLTRFDDTPIVASIYAELSFNDRQSIDKRLNNVYIVLRSLYCSISFDKDRISDDVIRYRINYLNDLRKLLIDNSESCDACKLSSLHYDRLLLKSYDELAVKFQEDFARKIYFAYKNRQYFDFNASVQLRQARIVLKMLEQHHYCDGEKSMIASIKNTIVSLDNAASLLAEYLNNVLDYRKIRYLQAKSLNINALNATRLRITHRNQQIKRLIAEANYKGFICLILYIDDIFFEDIAIESIHLFSDTLANLPLSKTLSANTQEEVSLLVNELRTHINFNPDSIFHKAQNSRKQICTMVRTLDALKRIKLVSSIVVSKLADSKSKKIEKLKSANTKIHDNITKLIETVEGLITLKTELLQTLNYNTEHLISKNTLYQVCNTIEAKKIGSMSEHDSTTVKLTDEQIYALKLISVLSAMMNIAKENNFCILHLIKHHYTGIFFIDILHQSDCLMKMIKKMNCELLEYRNNQKLYKPSDWMKLFNHTEVLSNDKANALSRRIIHKSIRRMVENTSDLNSYVLNLRLFRIITFQLYFFQSITKCNTVIDPTLICDFDNEVAKVLNEVYKTAFYTRSRLKHLCKCIRHITENPGSEQQFLEQVGYCLSEINLITIHLLIQLLDSSEYFLDRNLAKRIGGPAEVNSNDMAYFKSRIAVAPDQIRKILLAIKKNISKEIYGMCRLLMSRKFEENTTLLSINKIQTVLTCFIKTKLNFINKLLRKYYEDNLELLCKSYALQDLLKELAKPLEGFLYLAHSKMLTLYGVKSQDEKKSLFEIFCKELKDQIFLFNLYAKKIILKLNKGCVSTLETIEAGPNTSNTKQINKQLSGMDNKLNINSLNEKLNVISGDNIDVVNTKDGSSDNILNNEAAENSKKFVLVTCLCLLCVIAVSGSLIFCFYFIKKPI